MTSSLPIHSLVRDRMSALYTAVVKTEEEVCTDEEGEEEDDDELFSTPHATVIKPLMSPRKRIKLPDVPYGKRRYHLHRQAVVKSVVYLVLLISLLVGMAFLSLQIIKALVKDPGGSHHGNRPVEEEKIVGCSKFKVEEVWTQTVHQLLTEAAFRLNDVNRDGTPDVVIGFATGADRYFAEPILCDLYFNGFHPCLGGLLALDGKTGKELWRHYSEHEIFGVNCNVDIDSDGVRDCLGAGRGGVFHAVSGATGKLLWRFDEHEAKVDISNLYTPQFIRDMNGDGIQDVLAMHGGDPLRQPGKPVEKIGRLIFFSGSTGEILKWVQVPDKQESYYSPQIYYDRNGREVVLFGTGGETHGGSLWAIGLQELFQGHIHQAKELYRDNFKGVMTPPVLVDITSDGVTDIIMAMYNSSVLAINGDTFDYIWNFTMPLSESYSTPAPGYYNTDNIPDFMVKYAHGPGFPIYYYSQSTIIDGKTGKALLKPYIKDTIGSQNSPLTVSMEGHGNDIFLYWISDCEKHEGDNDKEFTFVEGTNVHEQSRSDLCKLRFNSKEYTRLYMMNRQSGIPGTVLYDSEERWKLEHRNVVNTSAMAWQYVQKHPQFKKTYLKHLERQKQLEKESESGLKVDRTENKDFSVEAETSTPKQTHNLIGKKARKEYAQTAGQESVPARNKYFGADKDNDNRNDLENLYRRYGYRYPLGNPPNAGYWEGQRPGRYPYPGVSGTAWPMDPGINSRQLEDRVDGRGGTDHRYDNNVNSGYQNSLRDRVRPITRGQTGISGQHQYSTNPYQTYHTQVPMAPEDEQFESLDYPSEFWKYFFGEPEEGEYLRPAVNEGYSSGHRPGKQEEKRSKAVKTQNSHIAAQTNSQTLNKKSRNLGRLDKRSTSFSDVDVNHNLKRFQKRNIAYNGGGQFQNLRHRFDKIFVAEDDLSGVHSPYIDNHNVNHEDEPTQSSKDGQKIEVREDTTVERKEINPKLSDHYKQVDQSEKFIKEIQPNIRKRKKRHVGSHDDGGLQRLLSTGTLAPTLNSSSRDAGHSIDVIFATYWFYPAKTRVVFPDQQKCIDDMMNDEVQRFDPNNEFYGDDHDAYEDKVRGKCLGEDDDDEHEDHDVHESQTNYNPFNIHMGQMTVYRLTLKCTCEGDPRLEDTSNHCSKILPFDRQEWAAYMGTHGNSLFNSRENHQKRSH